MLGIFNGFVGLDFSLNKVGIIPYVVITCLVAVGLLASIIFRYWQRRRATYRRRSFRQPALDSNVGLTELHVQGH